MDGVILRACQRCAPTGNSFYGMDNGSFFVVTNDFTAGVANSNVEFSNNAVEQVARDAAGAIRSPFGAPPVHRLVGTRGCLVLGDHARSARTSVGTSDRAGPATNRP